MQGVARFIFVKAITFLSKNLRRNSCRVGICATAVKLVIWVLNGRTGAIGSPPHAHASYTFHHRAWNAISCRDASSGHTGRPPESATGPGQLSPGFLAARRTFSP